MYNVLKKELNLSDEKAMHVVAAFEETQKERIKNAMTEFKSELKDDFHKLDMKIEQSKSDMIKWFFAFFITLSLMMMGLYFKN